MQKFGTFVSVFLFTWLVVVVSCQAPNVKYKLSTLAGYDAFAEGIAPEKASFSNPAGLFVDGNTVYVSDAGRDRIRKVSSGVVTTIAGGSIGWSVENLLAPESVAVHPTTGEVYFADTMNHCIKKQASDGSIVLVAGSVTRGYSGDGGPAHQAQFFYPKGITITKDGNIYIADSGNHIIRKISSGIISTVAGTGVKGFSGDGGSAVNATLYSPSFVFVDEVSNEVYISDSGNSRVRKVSSGVIMTIVGGGSNTTDGVLPTQVKLSNPKSAVYNRNTGVLYVADTFNNRIIQVSNNLAYTLLGNSTLSEPQALFLQNNDLYFIDRGNLRVMKYSSSGSLSLIAGSGPQQGYGDSNNLKNVKFNRPVGLYADWNTGELLVADSFNHVIRKLDLTSGQSSTIVGKYNSGVGGFSGDGGAAISASLNIPSSVVKNSKGEVFISDSSNFRIRKVSSEVISTIAGNGQYGYNGDGLLATSTNLNSVSQLAFNNDGELLFSDSLNNKVRKVSANFQTVSTVVGADPDGFSPSVTGSLNHPRSACFLPNGDMIIADVGNARIRKVSNGIITTIAGKGTIGFSGDGGLALNAEFGLQFTMACSRTANEIYISDNNRIRKISNGNITTIIGSSSYGYVDGTLSGGAKLSYQSRLFVTDDSEILIAENLSYHVRKYLSNQTVETVVGSGIFGNTGDKTALTQDLLGVLSAISNKKGEIFFSEYHRIRKVLLNSTVVTIAGVDWEGFSGDGGFANQALVSTPTSLVLSPDETILYFADMGNRRIRKIDLTTQKISTIAGKGKRYQGGSWGGDGGLATDCEFIAPESIFLSSDGLSLYVVDSIANNIRMIDLQKGTIVGVVGKSRRGDEGKAQYASVLQPSFIFSNSSSHMLVSHNSSVRLVDLANGNTIKTVLGFSDMGSYSFSETVNQSTIGKPEGIIELPNGDILVADSDNHVIRKYTASDGIVRVIAGNGFSGYLDNQDASQATLNAPTAMIISPLSGQVFVSDTLNHVIRVLTPYCESTDKRPYIIDPNTLSTCTLLKCGNYAADSSMVCGGVGTCVSMNQCTCQSGYYGSNCEFKVGSSTPTISRINNSSSIYQSIQMIVIGSLLAVVYLLI